jgi:CBS domain-containing protein
LLDAHALILSLMLAQQSRDLASGLRVSNKVELAALDAVQMRRLKRALRMVENLPPLLRSLMSA